MNTLFDFVTHVKGIEYILSITFIVGYLIYWEALKPKPFRSVKETGQDDIEHIKRTGMKDTLRLVGKVASAPFVGLLYVILLPVGMISALFYALVSAVGGKSEAFSWRPAEAYLAGQKKTKKHDQAEGKTEQK
ncbi:MAG TPA: hypothetical protein VF903_09570 [Nitrospirota bacterium]